MLINAHTMTHYDDLVEDIINLISLQLNFQDLKIFRIANRATYNVIKNGLENRCFSELSCLIDLTRKTLSQGELVNTNIQVIWGQSFTQTLKLTWESYLSEIHRLKQQTDKHPELVRALGQFKFNGLNIYDSNIKESSCYHNASHLHDVNSLLLHLNSDLLRSAPVSALSNGNFKISIRNASPFMTRFPISKVWLNQNGDNLTELDFSYASFIHVPRSIKELKNLHTLNLSYSGVRFLPKWFSKLKTLKTLNLDHVKLYKLSAENRHFLKNLGFTDNNLLNLIELTNLKNELPSNKTQLLKKLTRGVGITFTSAAAYFYFSSYSRQSEQKTRASLLDLQNDQVHYMNCLLVLFFIYLLFCSALEFDELSHLSIDNLTAQFCQLSLEELPIGTPEAKAYEIGRKNKCGEWTPFFKSFMLNKKHYNEYYAGVNDQSKNLPSRVIFNPSFKAHAKNKLKWKE